MGVSPLAKNFTAQFGGGWVKGCLSAVRELAHRIFPLQAEPGTEARHVNTLGRQCCSPKTGCRLPFLGMFPREELLPLFALIQPIVGLIQGGGVFPTPPSGLYQMVRDAFLQEVRGRCSSQAVGLKDGRVDSSLGHDNQTSFGQPFGSGAL